MVRYCSVYGCLESSNTNKNRRFFCFPSDETRCKHWIKAVGRVDFESKDVNTLHTSYFVCDLHFADSDCPNKYLRGNAVPTLFLPQLEDTSGASKYTQTDGCMLCCACQSIIKTETPSTSQPPESPHIPQNSQSTQTTKILSDSIPQVKKLRLELQAERKKLRVVETMYNNVTHRQSDIPPLLKKIIDARKRSNRKSQGARYDEDYMTFASNIYSASPEAYRILSDLIHLPAIRTLQRRTASNTNTSANTSTSINTVTSTNTSTATCGDAITVTCVDASTNTSK